MYSALVDKNLLNLKNVLTKIRKELNQYLRYFYYDKTVNKMIMFLVWILPKQFWEEIINNPLINALAEFGILLQRLLLSYPHKPLKKAIFQIYTCIYSFILFIYCRVLVIGLILLYGFLSAMTRGSSVKCQRQMVFIWLSHTNQIIDVSFFPYFDIFSSLTITMITTCPVGQGAHGRCDRSTGDAFSS